MLIIRATSRILLLNYTFVVKFIYRNAHILGIFMSIAGFAASLAGAIAECLSKFIILQQVSCISNKGEVYGRCEENYFNNATNCSLNSEYISDCYCVDNIGTCTNFDVNGNETSLCEALFRRPPRFFGATIE